MGLTLGADDLDVLFPARIEATREGHIIRLGASLERLIGPHHLGVPVFDLFTVERPSRTKSFDDLISRRAQIILRMRNVRSVRMQGVAFVVGDCVYLLMGHALDLRGSAEAPSLKYADFSPADGSSEAFLAAAVQAQFAEDAGRLAHDLERARRAAEAANNAKGAFMANVTHELRTPLNAVIGYSELMRESAVEEGRDGDVADHDHVLGAAKGLLGMINDVLDFTRLETQRLVVEAEPFAVCQMLGTLCSELAPAVATNGNTIRFHCEPALNCEADAGVIERCLRLLVSNAAKFTSRGAIEVRARRDGRYLVLDVCDTGIGIADEALADLFVAFKRQPSDSGGGAGLGLALTRRLVEALGGQITATSTLGEGSTFTLRLPVMFEAHAAA